MPDEVETCFLGTNPTIWSGNCWTDGKRTIKWAISWSRHGEKGNELVQGEFDNLSTLFYSSFHVTPGNFTHPHPGKFAGHVPSQPKSLPSPTFSESAHHLMSIHSRHQSLVLQSLPWGCRLRGCYSSQEVRSPDVIILKSFSSLRAVWNYRSTGMILVGFHVDAGVPESHCWF